MFIKAIERASAYTRPIHNITRTYTGKKLIPGAATLFFVNNEGYAVTCKHVIDMLANAENVNTHYNNFKQERQTILASPKHKQLLKGLELKYNYKADSAIQSKNNFVDIVDTMSGFTWHTHPTLDLAILKFNDFKTLLYKEPAVLLADESKIKQGKYLCRLGFPFAEFNNYQYNQSTDDIEWTQTGLQVSPIFPLEGMITRFLGDPDNGLMGIEMSTPGLRGQSGGPLFDDQGIVYGMQFSTKHLHLGFDLIDKEIMTDVGVKKVSDFSFLHLGQCIHINVIKAFLKQHNVSFTEG